MKTLYICKYQHHIPHSLNPRHLDSPIDLLHGIFFAPQVGLILPQSPTVGPTYHSGRTTPRLPHDDTLPRRHQSNIQF